MEDPISNPHSKSSRRSFLKTASITLFGILAACSPRMRDEGQLLPGHSPTSQIKLATIPPTSDPTASKFPSTPTTSPSDTPQPKDTVAPTACAPDVECDQAILSKTSPGVESHLSGQRRVLNPSPTYIITSLCLRDGGCVEVCPVECIVPGKPQTKWPRYYIDPDTCIDCGACVPECPYSAIFPEDLVPNQYIAKGGEYINRLGICGHYEGINHFGYPVVLDTVCRLTKGQVVDLTMDIQDNYNFYDIGPGYEALTYG